MNCIDAGLHFIVNREKPIISMVMRDEFDAFLLTRARKAGARLLPGCEVEKIRQEADCVFLTTTHGEFTARYLIAADGATGTIARKSGWRKPLRVAPALEYETFADGGTLWKFQQRARFDFGIIPYGYAWVFPKDDHLSIGALTIKPESANLNASIKMYFSLLGLGLEEGVERHGYVIPLHPREDGFVRHRVLLVGDAAGLVDPVTGEGISFAIRSGQLAAAAIIDGKMDPVDVRSLYENALSSSILPELRFGSRLSRLLYHPRIRAWMFRRYGQRLAEAMTDVIMGERTYKEVLSEPRNYLDAIQKLWVKS
jgi:flavin-dependent dehydrogenase